MINLLNEISYYIYIFFIFHFLESYFFVTLGMIIALIYEFRKGKLVLLIQVQGDEYKLPKWQKQVIKTSPQN